MTKLKAGIVAAALVAGVATPMVMQHQTRVALQEKEAALAQQAVQLAQLAAENERLSNLVAQTGSSLPADQLGELMRLRGEVGLLRRQAGDLARQQEENRRLQASVAGAGQPAPSADSDPAAEQRKLLGIVKMGYARNWMLAFHAYAEAHQGQFPTSFGQAASSLPDAVEMRDETLGSSNRFEIVYQGSPDGIGNPAAAIVLRENQSLPNGTGGWYRAYGFADGHAEIHFAPDGNFQPWEAQHGVPTSAGGR
ncbi:MAG: hypothetical protein ACYDH9_13235 [Limisphaerales bacterium]